MPSPTTCASAAHPRDTCTMERSRWVPPHIVNLLVSVFVSACSGNATQNDGAVADRPSDSSTGTDTTFDTGADATNDVARSDAASDRTPPFSDFGPDVQRIDVLSDTGSDKGFDGPAPDRVISDTVIDGLLPDGGGGTDGPGTDATSEAATIDGPSEVCNGLDDDGNGLIDDRSTCWITLYRFRSNTGAPLEARCLGPTATAPSTCADYLYEREAFIVPAVMIPGRTFPVRQCSRSTDHILVDERSSDRTVLEGAGYDCSLSLGFPYLPGMAPPARMTTFPYSCPLYRFRYSTGETGAHLFTTGTDSITGLTCEPPARADVQSTTPCFTGAPSGC